MTNKIQYLSYINRQNIIIIPNNPKENDSVLHYKYSLYVPFDSNNHDKNTPLTVIMMNPSKADENISDNSVNKVINLAYNKKYPGVTILNILPYYSTDSSKLKKIERHFSNEIIEENYEVIKNTVETNINNEEESKLDILMATGNPTLSYATEALKKINSILKEFNDSVIVYGVVSDLLTIEGNTRHVSRLSSNDLENMQELPDCYLK